MLQVALYLLVPALVLRLETRGVVWVRKAGPVVLCYAAGIVMANLGLLSSELAPAYGRADLTMSAAVALGLPMLLMTFNLRSAGPALSVLGKGFACVCASVLVGVGMVHLLWPESGALLAAMFAAVYIGGSPNLGTIKLALSVPESDFLAFSGADLLAGSLFLLCLLSWAPPLLRRLLGASQTKRATEVQDRGVHASSGQWARRQIPAVVASALGILGCAGGLTFALRGGLNEADLPVFFLLLTSGGLIAGQFSALRKLQTAPLLGGYLLLVFCVAVGSLADLATLQAKVGAMLAPFMAMFATSLIIAVIGARILRIPADEFSVALTAAFYGPPFVPPVGAAFGREDLVPLGIVAGALGLALGNYVGIGMGLLLAG